MRRFHTSRIWIGTPTKWRYSTQVFRPDPSAEKDLLDANRVENTPLHRAAYPEEYPDPDPVDHVQAQLEANDLEGSPLGYGGILEEVRGKKKEGD